MVARDTETGQLGVAVQSHYFAVGSVSPHAEAGVAAMTIQSFAKPRYAVEGLRLIREGASAQEALTALRRGDTHAEYRQSAIADTLGGVAVHTGERCIPEAGHHSGDGYACLGNMLLEVGIWERMGAAFEAADGELVDRLIVSLEAAQSAGGDLRGRRSAAVIVVSAEASGDPAIDVLFNLRVEDHEQPLQELNRLVTLKKAFHHNSRGDHHLRNGDVHAALCEFSTAVSMAPAHEELVFWQAVAMAIAGFEKEAEPLFRELFDASRNWRLLAERVARSRYLPEGSHALDSVLESAP
ncbi:protein of unknown function DUF1028 [Thioalkalivibrio nitratireducens DSM 14787]|uniref:DUF1028 domain-containing protein n=1 Tax=Thioalkalivibrio nitratireducens (strain DSM 14787 / UNIQEM 213 / ALEN2) TaxID=1255043 RepID=L0DTA9_THIND|nr:protein of unknown function DUF1028 [Thioalkalivibrio nitratireducens DSM 14787]